MIQLNRLIDHTILKPDTTRQDIERTCREAIRFEFATVFVSPCWISIAKDLLKSGPVKLGSTAGFPLGANHIEIKVKETQMNIADGADEIDAVLNLGKLKENDYDYLQRELSALRNTCGNTVVLKIIIETGLLTEQEKREAALLVRDSGADFVKTSTGFGPGGAKVDDICLLRETLGPEFKIKASGGIRDCQTALRLVRAGATRIGTSASVKIVREYKELISARVR
jgi:deoxyribose-phosphate aldolase